jgi:hypothetical protein
MNKLNKDETTVNTFLSLYGLKPERLMESETQNIRTPDFKVTNLKNDFSFFFEVKSLNTKIGEDGLLHTRIFNIFTATIHNAFGQFNAVNFNHSIPNILVYVSHNFQIDWRSFRDFIQGHTEVYDNLGNKRKANFKQISFSNYNDEMKQIDLFVFLQGEKQPCYFFNGRDKKVAAKFKQIFRKEDKPFSHLSVG